MQISIYILVCASVRTCDDPLESFNVFNLLVLVTVSPGRRARLISVGLCQFRLAYFIALIACHFGELRKPSNSYKIDVSIFKAQLISGST